MNINKSSICAVFTLFFSTAITACSVGTAALGPPKTQAAPTTLSPEEAKGLTYHKDIRPIATVKCGGCHSSGGIGPFTLSSYADVKQHLAAVSADVSTDLMPPWMPDDTCNSYQDDLSLSADEKSQVSAWIANGAPEGNPDDYVDPGTTSTPTFRSDLTITKPSACTPKTSPDEYRCFVIPWDAKTTKYVTGFGLKPGNPAIVHHAIVDIVSPSQAAAVRAKDGADGSPGWDCGQSGASLNWLAAWAPGGLSRTFGTGDAVGTKIEPGTVLVMQMHYHVYGNPASGGSDQSSIELQLSDQVEKEGHFVQLLDLAWVAGNMPIAAGAADVAHSYQASPSLAYALAAQALPNANMVVYQVAAHMHQRGSQANLTVNHNGQKQCLLNIPRWNFNWQNGYQLSKPFELAASDSVSLTCHWDNSPGHQPTVNGQKAVPRNLNWGEGSDDEMCIGFLYMAPK